MRRHIPFDKMTILEIEAELKQVYAELLKAADSDDRFYTSIRAATENIARLREHFERLRKLTDKRKSPTKSGPSKNA